MRKSDKKKNFLKVNLLAEQRYLKSKGIVTESFHMENDAPIGVDKNHMPVNEYGQSKQFDLRDEQNMKSLVSMILSYLGKEKTNDASIANDNKVIVYTELLNRLMQMSPPSTLNNGENGNEIYTNNPEAMRDYLTKFNVGGNFRLIGSDGSEVNEGYISEAEGTDLEYITFSYNGEAYGVSKVINTSETSNSFTVEFGLDKYNDGKRVPVGGMLTYYFDMDTRTDKLLFTDGRFGETIDAKKMIDTKYGLYEKIKQYVETRL